MGRLGGRAILAALAIMAMAGCSSIRLAYTYADDYVLYTLDSALDLDDDQRVQTAAALRELHAWHRQNELAAVAASLREAQAKLAGDPTPAEVQAVVDRGRAHIATLIDTAARPLAALLLTLRAEQVAGLETRFAREGERWVKEARDETAEERLKRRTERAAESYRNWLGRLTPAQTDRLREVWRPRGDHHETAFVERRARQAIILALVRDLATERPALDEAERRVRRAAQALEQSQDPSRRAYFEKLAADTAAAISDVLAMRTPEQRRYLDRRVAGLIDDVGILLARAASERARPAAADGPATMRRNE
jgi:hypothetical protein